MTGAADLLRAPAEWSRTVLLAVASLVLAAALGLSAAAPASAHASLVESNPAQGEQLDEAPEVLSFTMDEPVQLVEESVQLIDAQNQQIDLGDAEISDDRTVIEIPVEGELSDSAYLASIRAVSQDSHVVAYSIQFTVGDADLSGFDDLATGDYGASGGAWNVVIQVARSLGYAGSVLSFGLIGALWLSGRNSAQLARKRFVRLALAGVGLLIAGAALNLTAHGPYSLGSEEWTALLRLEGLSSTFSSAVGWLLVVRMVAAALLGSWILWRIRRFSRADAAVLGVLGAVIAYTFAASGHAAVGGDAPLALVATSAHVVAMAVWIGGLTALAVGGREPVLTSVWSRIALICLAVVVTTGIYLGARSVYPVNALWHSTYGLLLLAKVAGVVGIVVLAVFARRWLRGRSEAPLPARVEVALGAAVLVVTTVLATTTPARDDYGPPLELTAELESGTLNVAADSTRRGPVTLHLEPSANADEYIEGISASLSSEEAGVTRLPVSLSEEDGVWQSSDVIIPAPGEWTLTLVVDDGTSPIVTEVRYVVW